MEITLWCNSFRGPQIATNLCTWHGSIAAMPCAKFRSNHFIIIWMRIFKWFLEWKCLIFQHKILLKWVCKGFLDDIQSWVQAASWCVCSSKPLHEPVTKILDAIGHSYAQINEKMGYIKAPCFLSFTKREITLILVIFQVFQFSTTRVESWKL